MIAPDREHAISAQKVEIFVALAVEQILSGAVAEPNVISDRAQDTDHLLVEMAHMCLISVGFVLRINLGDVHALERAIGCVDQMGPMAQLDVLPPPRLRRLSKCRRKRSVKLQFSKVGYQTDWNTSCARFLRSRLWYFCLRVLLRPPSLSRLASGAPRTAEPIFESMTATAPCGALSHGR